ncbi:MAG: serine/threonine protein kinase [Gemmatimonadaceae bacterium]|nr:serine/threonine protein kinase [Gemmatimonadaceae bacterium]
MTDNEQSTGEIRAAFAAGYEVERELLGGGMSRVFLANERALGRQVVLKILPPELAAGVNRERFRREVQLAAQLQHPHIVPLYAAGAEGDLLYYTMPYIEGESLKLALQAHRKFSPREVISIMHDVVDALGYAHARGVIHRDIKPGNVLMSGRHAVVTDFGVAKAISASIPSAGGMTRSGMVVGSPAYMAPEQLAGDPSADHRVDIYAAGLLAYELLTGHAPFASASPAETMAAQLTRRPDPIEATRRDAPPALTALIMRCLAKSPADRPADAGEVLAALDAIPVASGEYRAASGNRRRWLLAAAAVAVVAAGIAIWRPSVPGPATTQPSRDTVTVSPAGPLLTRAESLAIAHAVEARVAEQRGFRGRGDTTARGPGGARGGAAAAAPGALSSDALRQVADSIRDEIQRAIFDSLARVQAAARADVGRGGDRGRGPRPGEPGDARPIFDRNGPPSRFAGLAPGLDSIMRVIDQSGRAIRGGQPDTGEFARRAATLGPQRRIVITEPRVQRFTEAARAVGADIANSLRRVIGAAPRFILVPQDSVAAALQKTRTVDDLAKALNAEMFASISVYHVGPDSVRWQVALRDLTASSAYSLRSWISEPTPANVPPPGLDTLLAQTVLQLNEMDRAPRQPYRPPPPRREFR